MEIRKSGTELIAEERARQISQEGWTPEHDDKHTDESMAYAAACFAAPRQIYTMYGTRRGGVMCDPFPWGHVVRNGRAADDPDGWHTYTTAEKKEGKDRLRQLVIAGALIAAEIDRLQRARQPIAEKTPLAVPPAELKARLISEYLITGMHHSTKEAQAEMARIIAS